MPQVQPTIDLLDSSSVMQIIGNPGAGGEPVVRKATLDDVEDDCEICQQMRKQILAGNAPTVMFFGDE